MPPLTGFSMTALNSQVKQREENIDETYRRGCTSEQIERLKYGSLSVTEVQPMYRRKLSPKQMPTVTSDGDAHTLFMDIWDLDKMDYCERVYALFLSGANKVLCWALVEEGGISNCRVHPPKVLTLALITHAAKFLIAHNHPSGVPTASAGDKRITKNLVEAASKVSVPLLDHLIVTSEGDYVSLRAEHPELF